MKITKQDIYFSAALLTAIYFAMISPAWTYLMNLIIGIPVFLVSYLFWNKGKKQDPKIKRYKYIPYIWGSGIVISIISLIGYLVTN